MSFYLRTGLLVFALANSIVISTSADANCTDRTAYMKGLANDIERANQSYPTTMDPANVASGISCRNEKYLRYLWEKATYLRECYAEAGETRAQAEQDAETFEAMARQTEVVLHNCR
jgi:hypothetical protein